MAEYIEKETVIANLIEQIEKGRDTAECEATELVIKRFAEYIGSFPAADVQPVKRGKWETWGYIFNGTEWLRCSRCGKPADVSYFKLLEGKIEPATLSICGCCGANMEAE